jgi:hypothetical protein
MGALQVRAGLRVVEVGGIERDELGLAALVLDVTDRAVSGLVPMEARPGRDAGGDLCVAGQALGGRDLPGGRVARGAPGVARLDGVGRAQRTWAFLALSGPGGGHGERKGYGERKNQDQDRPEAFRRILRTDKSYH